MKQANAYLILGCLSVLALSSCKEEDKVTSGPGVFYTPSGDASIEGELFLPDGDGPFPSMIIVPGSGNEPRQDLEPFLDIILPQGYAVYLYDKRGIGGSTGSYPPEGSDPSDFLYARGDDILGILDLLKTHTQIDNERMGLFGSSQGAWVNSIVYSQFPELGYIINASGGVAATGLEGLYDALTDDPSLTIDEAIQELANYTGPLGFDPLPIIQTITIPVLWIYGNEDRSHPARYDIDVLENLNKPNFTIQVYLNADHDLIDQTTMTFPADLFSNYGIWLNANN